MPHVKQHHKFETTKRHYSPWCLGCIYTSSKKRTEGSKPNEVRSDVKVTKTHDLNNINSNGTSNKVYSYCNLHFFGEYPFDMMLRKEWKGWLHPHANTKSKLKLETLLAECRLEDIEDNNGHYSIIRTRTRSVWNYSANDVQKHYVTLQRSTKAQSL